MRAWQTFVGALLALPLSLSMVSAALAQEAMTTPSARANTPARSTAERLLAVQNAERQRLGLAPLTWDPKLESHAKQWADKLAASNMFEHSVSAADGGEGENLWFGSTGDYTPEEMIGAFIDERKDFKPAVFPNVSATGRWEDVGHYTQLVWHDTRQVGCAVASNRSRDILVCRYWPAGNTEGEPVYSYGAAKQAMQGATKNSAGLTQINPPKPRKRASQTRPHGG